MDSLRPIIANLAIYKSQQKPSNNIIWNEELNEINESTLKNNNSDLRNSFKIEELNNISKINNQEEEISIIKNSNIFDTKKEKKNYEIPTQNEILRNKITKQKINNIYKKDKYMQHNHYLYNPSKNYIEKNKSSLREIE